MLLHLGLLWNPARTLGVYSRVHVCKHVDNILKAVTHPCFAYAAYSTSSPVFLSDVSELWFVTQTCRHYRGSHGTDIAQTQLVLHRHYIND